MNLVFNEYIKFLEDKGLKLKLKEGYYWYDKSIIKAFDKQGNIHKIVRLLVDDDLNISFKFYENDYFDIESWEETVNKNIVHLKKLEHKSLDLIRKSINKYDDRNIAILISGGKDSAVVSYLTKKICKNAKSIFNNTSLDCADTYLYVKKEDNLTIINPTQGFYQWREKRNFVGNRLSRACCEIFKEGAMIDYLEKDSKYLFFMGMRNQESNKRSNYKDEWKNLKWKSREWKAILPIREWSELDVWLYIIWRNIPINAKYKKGYTRVGCSIACPFYTKNTWALDKYWFPMGYDRWHKILEKDFLDNKKAPILNCTLKEYHTNWNGTRVREVATKEVIEEFSATYGIDKEIAKKYFDKRCICCNKKLKKNDIALSLKYYGRFIEQFKCLKCISEDLNVPPKILKEKINDFKNQGCTLF